MIQITENMTKITDNYLNLLKTKLSCLEENFVD